MKTRNAVLATVGMLTLSGAVLAQGGMGMHGGMGMMGDGDAKVTKEQFMQRSEQRFARMDFNKDGVIDASDRKKMHEQMSKCMDMTSGMGDKAGGATPQGDDHSAHHPAP